MIEKKLNADDERILIYEKLRESFDFLENLVASENADVVHKIRATQSLGRIANSLRHFIKDEEKVNLLEREIKKLARLIEEKDLMNKQINNAKTYN